MRASVNSPIGQALTADARLALDHARKLLDGEPRSEKVVVMEAEAELAEIAR